MSAQPTSSVESYHTQHAPFGAFASFTVGLVGAPGGFGQSLAGPARQNVYVGFRQEAEATWQLLPFFTPPQSRETAFTGAPGASEAARTFAALAPEAFKRELGWASDTWTADGGRFGFALLTPFSRVPDPSRLKKADARRFLAPVVCGWIEYDNRDGSAPVELMFGIGDPARPLRPLPETHPELAGFAGGTSYGFATKPGRGIALRQGFDVFAPKFTDYHGLHVIGGETALVCTVPAGKMRRFPLALGFYQSGVVTTGITASYAYTRVFTGIEDVLAHGLEFHAATVAEAASRDRELASSHLDADQRFLLAQSTHSYYGSTELLWRDGQPLWVVNEGEYRMINTFDLTVDHIFFELAWHPWAVKNTLDLFVERYAYHDKIKGPSGRLMLGGMAFTHDMGVMDHFSSPGRSSYECDGLTGCFSHMTMEQLLNWILTAVTYAEKTGDKAWLRKQIPTLLACAESLRRRDHPDRRQRDGVLKFDSDRCGPEGAEITTYDSLDVSLGQARNNLYLAVKTLGAWVLLEQAFKTLKRSVDASAADAAADRVAATLQSKFELDTGFFPAVFEDGNRSRILPAIEGFVYPLYLGLTDVTNPKGRFAGLLAQLRQHLTQALQTGVCLDATTGGWKISSTSTNTWFSKIALAQHVVRRLMPEAISPEALAADRVHADWQRRPGCGEFAMCDQILSDTGKVCGSRYYPRGVTAYLWLSE